MDRQELLGIEYHWREHERHLKERRRIITTPPKTLENTPKKGATEAFDAAYSRIEPLLRQVHLGYQSDWVVTPEVPITGEVEGEEVTIKLSFNVNGDTISPWINGSSNRQYDCKGVDDLWISRSWCVATDEGKSSDSGSYPTRLAHIEELIDIYFETIEQMTPEQLSEAGFDQRLF